MAAAEDDDGLEGALREITEGAVVVVVGSRSVRPGQDETCLLGRLKLVNPARQSHVLRECQVTLKRQGQGSRRLLDRR